MELPEGVGAGVEPEAAGDGMDTGSVMLEDGLSPRGPRR